MKIRTKYAFQLALLLTCALVLNGAVAAWVLFSQSKLAIGSVQRALASAAAMRVDTFIASVAVRLREIGEQPWDGRESSIETERDDFHRFLKLNPAVREIARVDQQGRELLFASRIAADRVSSMRLRPAPTSFLQGSVRGVDIGEEQTVEGADTFAILRARANSAGVDGYVYALVNLRAVSDVVETIDAGSGGSAYLADSRGKLVAHSDVSQVFRRRSLSDLEFYGPIHSELSVRELATVSDVIGLLQPKALISGAKVGKGAWVLYVEQPMSEVLVPVLESVRIAVGLLAIFVFVGWLAASVFAHRLSLPILTLRQRAQEFGAGELSARIEVGGGEELESLAMEFNKMADQLQSYTTSLEQKVSEKTAQLELANRHKSEFLANMSHELRTPLNAVIGFSDVLKEQYFGELNPKQQQYVKDINESGQHLLSLINDILDLSKIEAGKMDLELSRFHLPTSLDNALVLVRERATRRQLQLKASIAEDIGDIVADERKVKQILINLLTNAVKFSHPGGWVEVLVVRGTNETMMTVKDMGPGIAKADQAEIFEEFHQLNTGGSAKQEGTGLGLSLARRFTELHGGRIWVESEPGAGAAFTFTLPDRELPADGAAHSGAVA